MKKYLLLFISIVFTLFGCVEKEGDYGATGNAIITNLTNKEWNRQFHSILSDGTELDMNVTYFFEDNGHGTYKEIASYKNGKKEERISYFHWTFTTPNFQYIYLDLNCYWEIAHLSTKQLSIYETWEDPLTNPGQTYRDYQEYHSLIK